MKYDDASWHYESTPECEDDERWLIAAAHIGVYLKWCFLKGWGGELHTESDRSREAMTSIKEGGMTGSEFLITHCDCQFTDEDLTSEGNAFSEYYYEKLYTTDLTSRVGNIVLQAPETSDDYSALSQLLDERYNVWVTEGRPAEFKNKPWWKFW